MPMWGQPQKTNRNCFARAFRWYSKEREPTNRRMINPELTGFATWLDAKYGEYVRETEVHQEIHVPPSQRTATITPTTVQPNPATVAKRFPRMKSPWSRRKGAPCKIANPSCEFILQPKELARPASECLYCQTPSPCKNKSKTSVLSIEIEEKNKTTVKSRSMTSVQEKITQDINNIVTSGPTTKASGKSLTATVKECETSQKVESPPKLKRLSISNQNYKIEQDYKATNSFSSVRQEPLKPQVIKIPCDQGCKANKECKVVRETNQMPVKLQMTTYEQSNRNNQDYIKSEILLGHATTNKRYDLPCDQKCMTIKETYTANEQMQQINTKSNTFGIACECDCTATIEREMLKEKRRVAAKSSLCACKPNNMRQEVYPKPKKLIDIECQCPEEIVEHADTQVQWEYSQQTVVSTSTSDLLCKCVVVEKLPPAFTQVPMVRSSPKHFFASSNFTKKSQKAPSKMDVICQCPEENVVKFDTPTQYDRRDFEIHRNGLCVCLRPEKPTCTCVRETDSYLVRNFLTTRKTSYSLATFRNDAAQTSDHSITLERDDDHDYAFFMKIIRADRLNDCSCE
ncbi:uncharacterized protein LOC142986295 [Anticarsia gemmatalis]|uniref:uncharacterized protein LOC142986295 n=1 Tax=Anticarsia gemmatalis TaxID=129554 RepID=UPI003F75D1B9